MGKQLKTYALYKGDEFLIEGTIKEIAEQRKVKQETIRYFGMPSYIKRREGSKKQNFLVLVPLDDEKKD